MKDIHSIDCVTTNSAKLITSRGDVLTVGLANPELRVTTSFGPVSLLANTIRRASVSATSPTSQLREGLGGSWLADGDNKDGDIVVPSSPDLVSMQQTRQLTIEVWIKPNSIPSEFPVLLMKGSSTQQGANFGGYEFLLNAHGDNDLVFLSGGYQVVTHNANGRWINNHLGEWIHVAFTMDDQAKTAKFYVNGQPTNDERVFGTSSHLNFDVPSNLYIGTRDPANTPNASDFDGEMRDLKLFNRALTAAEIHEDYEASKLH